MDGKVRGWSGPAMALLRRLGWFFGGMAVLGACLLARRWSPAESATAAGKPPASAVKRTNATEPAKKTSMDPGKATPVKKPPVAAMVNNEPISREDLARECLLHYGNDVLDSIVNRTLIQTSCQQRNITITEKQVDEEIDRMARKASVAKDQWLKMLEKERGLTKARYAQDIIWPMLALRELAKHQLTVTKQELDEAYEGEFGPSVKVRLIAMDSAAEAKRVHAEATAKPEEFAALAKKYSKDSNSASVYGLIQPIRRHSGDEKLEAAAFALKKGEVSKIVQVGNLHVFVKCEEHLEPRLGVTREQADPLLTEAIKERKLRAAAGDVFKDLQKEAKIVIAYNDPAKSKEMPGVAAVINGKSISLVELAEETIERHGTDVLAGAINRRMLDQAMRKRKLQISDADINTEIARAAATLGRVDEKGKPDIEGWLEYITQNENVTREVYVRDEVWPSVALKKLVGDKVEVTQEDLKRGYDANYGPKVRCRAIVVNNQRRAEDVWAKARDNPTVKNFGDLAEQYSIEAGSRSLRGEVPPIQKNGGQPLLEQEAFSLKQGELSGIVQVGDAYVILLCEGYTKPIDTSFEEVKDLLYRDIHEKKLRVAMGKAFDALKENSRVDNFLAGTSKVPKKEEEAATAAAALAPDSKTPKPKVLKR